MKKYTKYRAGISLFFGALLIVGILNMFWAKPTYSEVEKRDLATKPEFSWSSLVSGEYISAFQLYFSDTFLGREPLMKLGTWFRSLYGVSKSGPQFVPIDPTDSSDHGIAANTSSRPLESASSEGASGSEPPTSSDGVSSTDNPSSSEQPSSAPVVSRDETGVLVRGYVVSDSTVYQLYNYDKVVNNRYAAVVSDFADRYPSVNTYCMVVPINTAFYLPEAYLSYTSNEKESIQKIYAAMSDKVHTVDAYSRMEQHANEYIYFRTDHHWTQLGAYYGYTAFAEATGTTPFSLEGLRTIRYDNFLGTLYDTIKKNNGDVSSLEKNPDYVTAYIPDFEYKLNYYPADSITKPGWILGKGTLVTETLGEKFKNKYMCFIHGDQPMEIIENYDNQNGKTLMIFKESYGNAFTPLVCHDYQRVIVIDPRYFKCSLKELMSMYDVTDALFLNYILAPGTPQRVKEIERVVKEKEEEVQN